MIIIFAGNGELQGKEDGTVVMYTYKRKDCLKQALHRSFYMIPNESISQAVDHSWKC